MAHPGFEVASTTLAGTAYTTTGASGNYGLMDGINAISWVQANAATFGGDSTKVSLFGESAGAAYLAMFAASPFATTLGVSSIIIESPYISYTGASLSMGARQEMGLLFTHRAGCLGGSSTSTTAITATSVPAAGTTTAAAEVACLRAADVTIIRQDTGFNGPSAGGPASSTTSVAAFDAYYGAGASVLFGYNTINVWPVVDGFVMTVEPLTGWSTLNAGVSIIVGHNADEYSTFCYAGFGSGGWQCPPTPFPDLLNIAWILGLEGTSSSMTYSAMYSAVTTTYAGASTPGTKMYALSNGLFYNDVSLALTTVAEQTAVQMATDAWFGNINTRMVESLYANPSRPAGTVYKYIFADETDPYLPVLGACHGCELTYVHGFYLVSQTFVSSFFPPSTGLQTQVPSVDKITLGTTMNTYWAAMFNTGSPNVVGSGLPTWTASTATTINTMIFQAGISTTGAAMNPCIRIVHCRTEPALNFRVARNHFWGSAPTAEVETPASCTTPAIGGYSHISTTAQATSCTASSCASWCNSYTIGLASCVPLRHGPICRGGEQAQRAAAPH